MIIIFGLGNPGKKYIGTRHNLGREVVNMLQEKWLFSSWQEKKKLKAEVSKGEIADKEVLLAKSLTFMNESGKAAKKLINYYQLTANNLFIIHDDIDLVLGKIKISKGRGAAGHKGVESVIRELGTKRFVRFRLGIGPKEKLKLKVKNLESFVLKKFKKEEKQLLKKAIDKTVEAIEVALKESVEKAMQKFN